MLSSIILSIVDHPYYFPTSTGLVSGEGMGQELATYDQLPEFAVELARLLQEGSR